MSEIWVFGMKGCGKEGNTPTNIYINLDLNPAELRLAAGEIRESAED